MVKTCLICTSIFKPYRTSNKYCSKKCRVQEGNKIRSDYKKQWNKTNQTTIKESRLQWLEKNPSKRKESSAKYQKANRAYYNSYSSLRNRYQKQAQLKSLTEWDLFYIEELYDIASKRGLEIDHIIPIKHNKICGLHVPWNLQMLTRSENAKKSNKYDEDVVCIFKDKQ